MKTPEQLINNIIGQLNGINRMLDEQQDCLSVLVQLKAAKSAMTSLANRLIEDDLMGCAAQGDPDKVKKLIAELTKNN